MDAIQPVLAVLFVLGVLGGALYWLRSKGLARFNGAGFSRPGTRQMQALERLPLTPQHSLHLVRIGGRTLLIAVSPGGCAVVDSVACQPSADNQPGDR
jgi:flagellar biogenesis protein FliO